MNEKVEIWFDSGTKKATIRGKWRNSFPRNDQGAILRAFQELPSVASPILNQAGALIIVSNDHEYSRFKQEVLGAAGSLFVVKKTYEDEKPLVQTKPRVNASFILLPGASRSDERKYFGVVFILKTGVFESRQPVVTDLDSLGILTIKHRGKVIALAFREDENTERATVLEVAMRHLNVTKHDDQPFEQWNKLSR
jgi:hypothetical protein